MDKVLSVSGLKKYYEVKRSAFSYKKEIVRAVDGVDLSLERGQTLGIVGESGSGKSTLLKALSRNLKPDKGVVYLEDVDVAKLSSKVIARKMAVLPQSPQAPKDLTVRDLVEYGRYPHQSWWQGKSGQDDACVMWALSQTGLTEMSERIVSTLSGGERQRVWIAMALAQKPEILLLDEPTTYLDICHQSRFLSMKPEHERQPNAQKCFQQRVVTDLNLFLLIWEYRWPK